MSQLEKKKFSNIINWIMSMDDKNLFKIMDGTNQLTNLNENIDFFLKHKFEGENKIPKFIIEEQENIKKQIKESNKKIINFLAPTSFGKSKILLDILRDISDKKVIICPTLALCNEYYIKINEMKIENIYVFTPEKANIFLSLNPVINFDIFVFDEFYEAIPLERRTTFINCLTTANIKSKKIILISPYGAKLSNFIESLNIFDKNEIFEISTKTSATSRIINLFEFETNKKYIHKKYFQGVLIENMAGFEIDEHTNYEKKEKKEWKNNIIIDKFMNEKETIIYTGINNIMKLSSLLIEKTVPITNNINEKFFCKIILEYLEINYPNTLLFELIRRGYSYHYGNMDPFLRFLIELAFKYKELNWILCTRTLSKGVNLDPKHLIIESTRKLAKEHEDNFSVEMMNMFGRTGRLTTNKFIGNLYLFIEKTGDKKKEIINILNEPSLEKELNFEEFNKENKIIDYKTASIFFEYNKKDITSTFSLEPEKISILRKFLLRDKEIKKNDDDDLDHFLEEFFKITWNNSFGDRKNYINYFFNNWGYSKIYIQESKKSFDKEKINDILLKDIIEKYETFIGYHLNKILMIFAEIMQNKNMITENEYIEIISDKTKTENNNFPDVFNKALSSNLVTEDTLNKIVDKLSERDKNEK